MDIYCIWKALTNYDQLAEILKGRKNVQMRFAERNYGSMNSKILHVMTKIDSIYTAYKEVEMNLNNWVNIFIGTRSNLDSDYTISKDMFDNSNLAFRN